MKKIITICMIITLVAVNFLVVSIFKTIDLRRVNEIEMNNFSFKFYLNNVALTNQEQLIFLSELSEKYNVSIFKTDIRSDYVLKSVIFEESSFPFEQFNLESKKLFENIEDIYGNVSTFEGQFVEEIPTFSKENKIVLQSFEHYSSEADKSSNGVYSIVSTNQINQEAIVKELSQFYGINQDKLLRTSFGSEVSLVTASTIYLTIVLIVTFFILSIAIIYVPITEIKKIGVMKLLGHSEQSIFFSFTKHSLMILVSLSVLFNIIFVYSWVYKPPQFMQTLILAQASVLTLFFCLNLITYLVIANVTASKMLKNYLELKIGIICSFILKGLLMFVVSASFLQISFSFNELIKDAQTSKNWENVGDFLTIEIARIMPGSQIDFSKNDLQYEKQLSRAFSEFEKELGTLYVSSKKIDETSIFYSDKQMTPVFLGQEYELIVMNYNYLETIEINHTRNNPLIREFLIPESYRGKEDWEFLSKILLYNTESIEEQKIDKASELEVHVAYYEDQKFSVFPHNTELTENFKKPIIVLFDSQNIATREIRELQNTGINNPLKIENTKNNRQRIKEILIANGVTEVVPQFSTIASILSSQRSFSRQGMLLSLSILCAIFMFSLAGSLLLSLIMIQSKKTQLVVYNLHGFKLRDKYKMEMYILFMLYALQLVIVTVVSKSILITISLLCLIGIDLLISLLLLNKHEKKNLVTSLKGA